MLQSIKNILKCILPPPVKTFLQEIEGLRMSLELQEQMLAELSEGIGEQTRLLQAELRALSIENTTTQRQLAAAQVHKQLVCMEEKQRQMMEKVDVLQTMFMEHQSTFREQQLVTVALEENVSREHLLMEKKFQDTETFFREHLETISQKMGSCLEPAMKKLEEKIEQADADGKQCLTKLEELRAIHDNHLKPRPVSYDYEYFRLLSPQNYRDGLGKWYKFHTKESLDLEHPRTFNEKIQWMKLYDSTPVKTQLTDKYLVRSWIREKLGGEYLIPLLGVWESFDEIDFQKLPDRFVLKANHGSGCNLVVEDKDSLDISAARDKFRYWMGRNFAFANGLELHYANITPKIIAEEYLENQKNDLYDYKVYCFGGRAECIAFMSGRRQDLKMTFYDLQWNRLSIMHGYPMHEDDVPRPQKLDLLIRLAEHLAEGFAFVRVDFYMLNDGRIKFGEMTFTPTSGRVEWYPPHQDLVFGDLIRLPEKSPIQLLLG